MRKSMKRMVLTGAAVMVLVSGLSSAPAMAAPVGELKDADPERSTPSGSSLPTSPNGPGSGIDVTGKIEDASPVRQTPKLPAPAPDPDPSPTPPVDPGKPDPGKPDPGKPDPGKPDPGKPDPGKPYPGTGDNNNGGSYYGEILDRGGVFVSNFLPYEFTSVVGDAGSSLKKDLPAPVAKTLPNTGGGWTFLAVAGGALLLTGRYLIRRFSS